MRQLFICTATLLALQAAVLGQRATIPNDDKTITHVLNRLAFGPTPDDIEQVKRIGVSAWIDGQLGRSRVSGTTSISTNTSTSTGTGTGTGRGTGATKGEVIRSLAEAKLARAVSSERQLEEMLVDFWFNHFNVFGRKGQIEGYIPSFERDVIRPRVLGKFRDLLGATAKSPAMLFYLDNWMSVAPPFDSFPLGQGRPFDSRLLAHPSTPLGVILSSSKGQGKRRGLNENYARELLELHTLGVDGGYAQQDVTEVARALTGWTIDRPRDGGEFRFAPAFHDRGEKRVLGHTIPARGGIEDGEKVLDIVANHPSTAKHIAFKLAQRFVSDTPPQALVDRAAARFRQTNGDLREVIRTIVTSSEFFAPEAFGAKVKTPFEFVASALRSTGAEMFSSAAAVRALAAMGMPLYLCQPPTGYDETAESWVSSGALVSRMNFAVQLSQNRLRGIRVPPDRAALAVTIGEPDFQRQ